MSVTGAQAMHYFEYLHFRDRFRKSSNEPIGIVFSRSLERSVRIFREMDAYFQERCAPNEKGPFLSHQMERVAYGIIARTFRKKVRRFFERNSARTFLQICACNSVGARTFSINARSRERTF